MEIRSAAEAADALEQLVQAMNDRDLVALNRSVTGLRLFLRGLAQLEGATAQQLVQFVLAELARLAQQSTLAGLVRLADLRDALCERGALSEDDFKDCMVALEDEEHVELLAGHDDGTRRGIWVEGRGWLNVVKAAGPMTMQAVGHT